ncbi:inositol monophosphatase [Oricola sp.]|uniref:inositol monophosphatase family protein n=1 Tax=Oricola sp. TaxID=1979950 RepID=UPI0025F2F42E|nr:inositol monophosphatase [Oricola sp.]MCI5074824.1 inositol monophosphatase [Oricola sp.]
MTRFDETAADRLLEIVRDAARVEVLPRFRNLRPDAISAKSSPSDLVTEADQRSEARMTAAINAALPDALVIGEEAVAADPGLLDRLDGADLAVILDPIDGTWNYAHGLATFGMILAVVAGGETVFGLLYDPIGDDWVMAHRGGGAWFGRPGETATRLRAAAPGPLDAMTGYVPLHMFDAARRPALASALMAFGRVGSLGCSCHEYRMLAQGHESFCLTASLNAWDHAAGELIHREAGGHAALLDGRAYRATMREGMLLTAPDEESWNAIRATLGFLIEG